MATLVLPNGRDAVADEDANYHGDGGFWLTHQICFALPSCSTALGYSRLIKGDKNSSSKSGNVNDFANGSLSRLAELREARMTSSLVTIVMLMRIDRVGLFLGLPIWKIVACIVFPLNMPHLITL